jgi:hypothetical protein
MRRANRLESARHWLPTYRGKDLVRGYAKWYGVDRLCAAVELQQLGAPVSPDLVAALRADARRRSPTPKQRARDRGPLDTGYGTWWDETFAFIAGRTEAGLAFGTTWEELGAKPPLQESEVREDDV